MFLYCILFNCITWCYFIFFYVVLFSNEVRSIFLKQIMLYYFQLFYAQLSSIVLCSLILIYFIVFLSNVLSTVSLSHIYLAVLCGSADAGFLNMLRLHLLASCVVLLNRFW